MSPTVGRCARTGVVARPRPQHYIIMHSQHWKAIMSLFMTLRHHEVRSVSKMELEHQKRLIHTKFILNSYPISFNVLSSLSFKPFHCLSTAFLRFVQRRRACHKFHCCGSLATLAAFRDSATPWFHLDRKGSEQRHADTLGHRTLRDNKFDGTAAKLIAYPKLLASC